MKIVAGLGNPGSEYERTRHNAGFLAVDAFGSKLGGWRHEKKFTAEIAEGVVAREKIILLKPQTFMNNSGQAVQAVARFFKVKPADVWVIHDDLDLPLGTLRLKQGGSAGGHKGVQSIINAIGPDFVRFRIGIAPQRRTKPADEFVLARFTKAEQVKLDQTITRATEALAFTLEHGLAKAMTQYHSETSENKKQKTE